MVPIYLLTFTCFRTARLARSWDKAMGAHSFAWIRSYDCWSSDPAAQRLLQFSPQRHHVPARLAWYYIAKAEWYGYLELVLQHQFRLINLSIFDNQGSICFLLQHSSSLIYLQTCFRFFSPLFSFALSNSSLIFTSCQIYLICLSCLFRSLQSSFCCPFLIIHIVGLRLR